MDMKFRKCWKPTAAATFAVVLGIWLAVHPQYATSRLAEEALKEIDIVDLISTRGCLVRLIGASQDSWKQAIGRPRRSCCGYQVFLLTISDVWSLTLSLRSSREMSFHMRIKREVS